MHGFKKHIISIIIVVLVFGVVICGQADTVLDQPIKYFSQLFKLKIYADKSIYMENEKIGLYAKFEYIGDNDQIVIYHNDPYISFSISDGKNFVTDEIFDATLSKTVIEKNKSYQFSYQKGGGYDSNSPNADMWKKFYEQKDLYLPKGKYTIKVRGAFYLDQNHSGVENNLEDKINIRVQ